VTIFLFLKFSRMIDLMLAFWRSSM